MAERKKAPPDSSPPFNMEDVEIIRKKSAPAGPPPPRMISFKAPKMSKADSKNRNKEDDNSDFKRDRSRSRSSTPDRPVSPELNTPEHRFKNNRPNIRRDRSESTDSGERRERLRHDRNDDDDRNYRGRGRSRSRSRSRSSETRYRGRSRSTSRDRRDRNDDDNHRNSERGRYRDRDGRSRSRSTSRDRRGRNAQPTQKSPMSGDGRKRGGSFVSLDGSDDDEDGATRNHRDRVGSETNPPGKNLPAKGALNNPSKAESKMTSSLKPDASTRESILSFTELMKSTYRELRNFVMNPPPARTLVKCYIERNKSASTFLSPVFSLCADLDDGTGRELITCRKIIGRSAHYVFSLKNDDLFRTREKRSKLYLGKLRSVSANEYVLYDNGACAMPDGKGDDILNAVDKDIETTEADDNEVEIDDEVAARNGASDAVSLYRSQLVVISFGSKKRPCSGLERGMEVCIPHPLLMASEAPTTSSASTADTSQKKLLMDIVKPFKTMREEGSQNEKYLSKLIVFHERNSK